MVVIRKYRPDDRSAVRRICCETALMGEPSSAFFDDDEIFADALTSYFTDHEPESSFVAEDGDKVVGYLTGSLDSKRMDAVFVSGIAAPLLVKAFRRGTFFSKKRARFISGVLASLIRGELRSPDMSKDYPATLHVNLIREYRKAGLGSGLISAYLDYLRSRGVAGVHCATMSDKAGRFFSSHGFKLLHEGRRSYFRHFLNRDVPVYVYGMRLRTDNMDAPVS